MKTLTLRNLFIITTLAAVLSACHKDKQDPAPIDPVEARAGIYILNQGNFGGNNGSITYYDYNTKLTVPDYFNAANNKPLGDTPNDMKIYGSKMYVVVDVSGVLEILNAKTGKEIKQIAIQNANKTTKDPRSIAFYKNKAYISIWDGTVAVLDTTSLTIDKYITVGKNPEQMVVSNGKLYVANSGGVTPGFDNTVSVVDLTTQAEIKKITVITNPSIIGADNYGHIYVFSSGDYANIAPGLTIINNTTDAVATQNNTTAGYGSSFALSGDMAYFITGDGKIQVYNTKTQTVASANFITDGTAIASPYNIAADAQTGEVFIADAKNYSSNGELFVFDKNGKKEYSVTTGINPGTVAFLNK